MNDQDVIDLCRDADLGAEPPLRTTDVGALVRAGRNRALRIRATRAVGALAVLAAVGGGIAVLPFGGGGDLRVASGGTGRPIVTGPVTNLSQIWPDAMASQFAAGWLPEPMTQRRTAYYPDRQVLMASRPGSGHSADLPVGVTISVFVPGAYPQSGRTSMATPAAPVGGKPAFTGQAPDSDTARGIRWEITAGQWAQVEVEQGALDDPRHGDGGGEDVLLRKVAEKVALKSGPARMPFRLAGNLPTLRVVEASVGHASFDKSDNAILRLTDTANGMRTAGKSTSYQSGLTIRVYPAPTKASELAKYDLTIGGDKARWQTEDGNPAYAGQLTVLRGSWAVDFLASREVLTALGGKTALLAAPGQLTLASDPNDPGTWFDWPAHASR